MTQHIETRYLTVYSDNDIRLDTESPDINDGGYTIILAIVIPESWRRVNRTVQVTIPDDAVRVSAK